VTDGYGVGCRQRDRSEKPTTRTAKRRNCGRSMGGLVYHEAKRSRGSRGPGSSESGAWRRRGHYSERPAPARPMPRERSEWGASLGTDEIDLNRSHISWVRPLGRACDEIGGGDRRSPSIAGGYRIPDRAGSVYERISVDPFSEPDGDELVKGTSSPTLILTRSSFW